MCSYALGAAALAAASALAWTERDMDMAHDT